MSFPSALQPLPKVSRLLNLTRTLQSASTQLRPRSRSYSSNSNSSNSGPGSTATGRDDTHSQLHSSNCKCANKSSSSVSSSNSVPINSTGSSSKTSMLTSGLTLNPVSSSPLHRQISSYLEAHNDEETKGKLIEGTMPELEDILYNNKNWVKEKNVVDPTFFDRIAQGQKPRYLYIGCSDARVDPGQLMGLRNAELFVHRNVGNVVSGTDLNFLTVLEYAVEVLRVPHIIVCGHYDCGAVRGSIARPVSGGLGLIENWLRNIRDVARLHMTELKKIEDDEQRQRRLVELNIMEQCLNIFKCACVQRRRLATYVQNSSSYALPRVHGLVFDVRDGILKKLELNFKQEIEDYREIYDLYKVPEWVRQRRNSNNGDEATPAAEFWDGKKET